MLNIKTTNTRMALPHSEQAAIGQEQEIRQQWFQSCEPKISVWFCSYLKIALRFIKLLRLFNSQNDRKWIGFHCSNSIKI